MPDKKSPSRKIHPAPPRPQAFAADQKKPREGKGAPDGVPGLAPGGYSTADDLPPDYYHGMWRERDVDPGDDPRDDRGLRKLAESWPRTLAKNLSLSSLVRSREHVYRQSAGHCFLACGIFLYFRRLGLTPSLAINAMKNAWIETKLPIWQTGYGQMIVEERIGSATLTSKVLSALLQLMDHAQRSGKLPALVVKRPISQSDIWTENLIGSYPHTPPETTWRTLSISNEHNAVHSRPHMPSSAGAATLQQALFSGYQPPRSTRIPLGSGCFRMNYALRRTLPLVILNLRWRVNAEIQKHAVLVDFTDHQHPGIFDPNFGWFEPQQGYSYLSFEMTLQTLWEYYTRHNSGSRMQGLRHHGPIPDDFRIEAFQLHEQSVAS